MIKSGMQHHMDTLKQMHGTDADVNDKNTRMEKSGQEKDREIAELYEDLYEYKLDLKCFEDELFLIKKHDVTEILDIFEEYKVDKRDYKKDLVAVLEHFWKLEVEAENYDTSQLDEINGLEYNEMVDKLIELNGQDVKEVIKNIFINRWQMLIDIKKDHIKEEEKEIKVSGLKVYYAERVYKRFHGIPQ
jgi:hypothetical protein